MGSINRGHCNDDEVTLNTQTTSQWDGFRHYPYQNYPEQGKYTLVPLALMSDLSDSQILRRDDDGRIERQVDHQVWYPKWANRFDIAAEPDV